MEDKDVLLLNIIDDLVPCIAMGLQGFFSGGCPNHYFTYR